MNVRSIVWLPAVLVMGVVSCAGVDEPGKTGSAKSALVGASCDAYTPCDDFEVCVSGLCASVPKEISAGAGHTCVRFHDGTVKCWGNNGEGELGDGTTTARLSPVWTDTLDSPALAMNAGGAGPHTCVVLDDNTVRCWGYNNYGQLGDGTHDESHTAVSGTGISDALKVSAGAYHTCALLSGGGVKCWGRGLEGQLGHGYDTSSDSPVTVSGVTTALDIAAGGYHTCALLDDGTVVCWGINVNGQLGNGDPYNANTNTPVAVSSLSSVDELDASDYHTCARAGGTVKCWGRGSEGQLGNAASSSSNTPVTVSGVSTASHISVGAYHSCAPLANGTVKCWGYNSVGQLGDGYTNTSNTPVAVSSISTAVAVATGGEHSCALLDDHTVKCWGAGSRLGDGNSTNQSTPVSTLAIP